MAAPPAPATPQTVMGLVYKLTDADPDFRFMSLNDLLSLLTTARHDFLHHDYNIAARTVDSIIKTLDDQNGEVQNLAVKCLGPLVTKVPTQILAPMIEKLSTLKLKNSVDNAIPSLALRTVITNLPRPVPGLPTTPDVKEAYSAVSRVLIPRLVGPGPKTRVPKTTEVKLPPVPEGMLQNEGDLNAESVDVMIEVVKCFGPLLEQLEVEAMEEIVMQLLESVKGTSVVKKRAVVALSMLAVYLTEDHLVTIVNRITSGLSRPDLGPVTRKLYIYVLGSMARSIPARFSVHIKETLPYILHALAEDELLQHLERVGDGEDTGPEFNDVREAALVALASFLASCPQDTKDFTDEMIQGCLRYLKYDPNYAVDDDDEDMDEDAEDDLEMDDEFEDDDGFEDGDDDASWKVRRCAAKALYTLIATRASGDLLENGVLYRDAAEPLIKRIDEREENVRLEVLSALALLVRKTGEGIHTTELAADDFEREEIPQIPLSRKRRRQSSTTNPTHSLAATGLASPVRDKIPQTGPQADLARHTPAIVKLATKHLKGKTVATKQAIISLLDDLVSVQRGGLADYFADIVGPVSEAIKPAGTNFSVALGGSGGATSATPSTLRIAALKLVSDISKTHSSAVLQPYLNRIVAAVTVAVHDRFYKISSEAVRTVEELIKTITPPRSRDAGTQFKDELDKLFDDIIDRGTANDADAEVRQRAIHAIGVLISRVSLPEGAVLLSADKRALALSVLQERLKNETTRIAAVRAVDQVAATAQSADQLDNAWVQDVALELASQLRKANRALRGSSVAALKHLTSSPAAKDRLDQETIQGIVSALLPIISANDTHLLGPTLIILSSLVGSYSKLILTNGMVTALCDLLKTHFASMVLDQILLLVGNIGKSGNSGPLMAGILQTVSISGEPAVVGKVIGTLLVTGGASSGVNVDSFVNELRNSSRDESRTCLALSVLGEAGKGLGSKSPLKPELFLEQFRVEPDKVSLSAAIALGRAGSSNVKEFLPVILKQMDKGGSMQYLLIQSLKEILQSISTLESSVEEYAPDIWVKLRSASEKTDNKVVCAECAGRLVTLNPNEFMPQLQALLSAPSVAVRGMAVLAIRYTLPETDEAFDAILRNVLIDMLTTVLKDEDLEIRRLAMTTLNSAAHNKPDLILPHLGELMPFVLDESVINQALIKEVMLGPFKHTVDDGLEVRKSAYETLYALMETAFSRINNIKFFDRVVAGLKDENDIRQLCNLMITKLIVIDPDESARRLDSIAEAYRSVLSIKLKDNAVKQDIEKQEEANKSILRVTLMLGDKMKALTGNAGAATSNTVAAGPWGSYWEWVNKEFDKQLKGVKEETKELQTRMA